ncbi:MAG: tetratricopeptide repeat protein [Bacteroidota bacterium]
MLEKSKEDTNKVKVLYQFSCFYVNSDPLKTFQYSKKMLALAQKLDFKEYVFKSYQMAAIYYHLTGNDKLALESMKKAIPIAEQMNDKVSLSDAYGNMGIISRRIKDYYGSVDYTKKSFDIAKEINDSSRMAHGLIGMGTHYKDLAVDYPAALSYIIQSLKISEARNDTEIILLGFRSIGSIYLHEQNFDKAIEYYMKGLKLADETNNHVETGNDLNNIGIIYFYKKDFDNALKYLFKALETNEQVGNKSNISNSYDYLANVFSEQKKFDKAIEYEFKSLHLSEQLDDNSIIGNYTSLGAIYMKMKEYGKAKEYLNKSLILAKKTEDESQQRDAYKALSQNYELMNDFKSAYTNLMEYMKVNDSISFEETRKKTAALTADLEMKYNSEKKENEIVILTKDKELQNSEIKKQTLIKNAFIGGLALLILLSVFIYNTIRTRQKLKLQTLRNKIASDLHDDVGSTLSSISIFSEIAKAQSSEVSPMLEQIGESSRKMLDAMADIVWTINPENDQFEKIILRMKSFAYELLGAKKIDFEFTADDSVSKLKLPMEVRKNLYLIFKEATNNMVKYAAANKASFAISGNSKKLTMFIRDNGKGFDVSKESQGNGLKNMKKRAMEIGANLLIESEAGTGTTIQLILNLA